ncbi:MAG: DnaB-like helicase C-terminal domain-containing protein [Nitrosarchaeum sp.]|nr:DnaB-like helicase C-terminal domain-containing protein [Nitrosarchaeum sp.]
MANIFASVKSENKFIKGLINHDDVSQELAAKNIEKAIYENINPDCFTSDFRGWLYSAIVMHFHSYATALTHDLVTQKIVKKYKKQQSIDDAKALLEKVLNRKFEVHEFEPVIDELKNLYKIRKIFETTQDVLESLRSIKEGAKDVSAAPLIRKLESSIEQINRQNTAERIIEENAFINIDKDMELIRDYHDNPEKYRGIDTGIAPLTLATNGWQGGDLITVMGRTGQGKSILLLNFAYAAWAAGNNVMYVSIEMPIIQQKRRLFSRMTSVPYFKIKNANHLSNEELIFIEEKIKEEQTKRENVFLILDAPNCSANFIEGRITNFEKTTGKKIGLVVVDPIYLMRPNVNDDQARTDPVGAVSWDLKLLARKFNVPVIEANQINREGHKRHLQGREMDAMDSSSSDRLGQNSDIMLGIFSDEQQWVKLSIVKYRDGKGPTLFLRRKFDVMKVEYDEEYNQHDEIIAQITGQGSDGSH